jgi:2-keto-4-pentenoate hydratase/2-oxohepta-3-ene-1,7-dioic acid hydratase in catechol pathway
MKLIRFGPKGEERPGLLLADGTRRDASAFGEDWNEAFFGTGGLERLAAWARDRAEAAPLVPTSERLGPPIARPSKIVCIGLNYADHARETGAAIPTEPVTFFKASTALCGPDDDLVLPRGSEKTDWEVELAVVIGRRARYVAPADGARHVAGYALHNDYSERQDQLERGGNWSKGKSHDTFAPLGPFLATPDEVADPHALSLWLSVNGTKRQDSSTREMVFQVPALVSYLSRFMTLMPGDVISTGTPPGVGLGFKPPIYLHEGDVVELGIEGLGTQRQRVVAPA